MKKVLVITNLHHASPRIPGLVKNLSYFGWEAVVLAPPSKDKYEGKIIETESCKDIFSFWRKRLKNKGFDTEGNLLNQVKEKAEGKIKSSLVDFFFGFYRTFFAWPDEEKKWKKVAVKKVEEVLNKEKFDLVLSSSSPATSHLVAKEIKKKHGIPWLADLRDLWTQNHDYPYPFFRKFFERKLEKKTLVSADALITVSEPLAEKLRNLHKKKAVYTILNGFSLEKINDPPVNLDNEFTITYTGQVYPARRDPLDLLTALSELLEEKKIKNFKLKFFGPENVWLEKKIEEKKLAGFAEQCGKLSRGDSIKEQRRSQLLLLLNWRGKRSAGVYTGKIFEYLAARRPILALGGEKGPENVIKNLVEETKTGFFANEVEDIKEIIIDLYNQYKRKGKIDYEGDWNKVKEYSQYNMAGKFSQAFNNHTLR